MNIFDECKRKFDADDWGALTHTPEGLLWLKLKSISRGELLDAIWTEWNLPATKGILNDSKPLIQNLYEEQGEMRFDASNRLFLILVDEQDFEASWKLKRNIELLTKTITTYLDNFDKSRVEKMTLSFSHKAKSGMFHATSDAIFVVRT